MAKAAFKELLENDTRKHSYRESLVYTAYENPELIGYLIEVMQQNELKYASLAARIIELICKKQLLYILPFIDDFGNSLNKIKDDATIRSSAKIIELICRELYTKYNPVFIDTITPQHIEQFTEACFDWMISEKATAIQAHSMYALYLLGLHTANDWIHEELLLNIEKSFSKHTIGYQNRGRKVIKAIKTNTRLKL